jgi:hypothetical protein
MAKIKLVADNHEWREKSLKLVTIFGDVYAPLSKITVVNDIAIVPNWVFTNKGLNPCQMVNGFIG